MEAIKILSADVLDIIFDARNKEYGAYELRKNYQRRLVKAMLITLLLVALICLTYVLLGSMKPEAGKLILGQEVTLVVVDPPIKDKIVVLPPLKLAQPEKIKMLQFTSPPIIAKVVDQNDMPPEQIDMDNTKIGPVNVEGKQDDGLQPPVEAAKGIVDEPIRQDNTEIIFTRVEIESQYPGGVSAWAAFLNRKLAYPQQAIDDGVQGAVIVQFIVDTTGAVSNIEAISGPDELRAAATVAIKQSGRWSPAIQNGRKVKSYKKQPITFRLPE
ncbi:MAG: TonB family protein [Chitinophagaceae bacterium]